MVTSLHTVNRFSVLSVSSVPWFYAWKSKLLKKQNSCFIKLTTTRLANFIFWWNFSKNSCSVHFTIISWLHVWYSRIFKEYSFKMLTKNCLDNCYDENSLPWEFWWGDGIQLNERVTCKTILFHCLSSGYNLFMVVQLAWS